jgi:D-arabinose 5-phosphate isomerase GutQ
MGDALAVALLDARGFKADDFAAHTRVERWDAAC